MAQAEEDRSSANRSKLPTIGANRLTRLSIQNDGSTSEERKTSKMHKEAMGAIQKIVSADVNSRQTHSSLEAAPSIGTATTANTQKRVSTTDSVKGVRRKGNMNNASGLNHQLSHATCQHLSSHLIPTISQQLLHHQSPNHNEITSCKIRQADPARV